jgi:ectoine hydroxylase-related dioxygenase (phytanoyl-CoA dioxygenase family)
MVEQGFSIEPAVLTSDECESLATSLVTAKSARGRAGSRNLMSHPDVKAVANDFRLIQIAARLLKHRAVPFRATFFNKSAAVNWPVGWHQDTVLPLVSRFESFEWGPWSEKAGVLFARAPTWALSRIIALRVHLDDSRADNGPLRVIPASHQLGVLSSEQISAITHERKHVECIIDRGGVLVMSPLLIHSSRRARLTLPRRVVHIEYADALRLGDDQHLATA